jgi:hypothetical protein
MTTKKISVTRTHIENGFKCNANECPVANALKDAGFSEPRVSDSFFMSGGRPIVDFPSGVSERIRQYDATGKMEPFEFEVSLS